MKNGNYSLSFENETGSMNLSSEEKVKTNSPDLIFDNNNLKWMTSQEAALFLRVSVGQLRNLVYQKKIRFYYFGTRLRFLRSDLDRLLKPSV
jgi:excisionase family DNA binding protein